MRQLIKQGNSEEVKEVLKNDQELLFAETPFGTWLEVAASKGQIELVKYLNIKYDFIIRNSQYRSDC
ncbi:hypothetical protein D6853_08885 [Butyrivibrio sp. X503]|nr:hypothetical protein D6853_08885 [Butyrivibrio sp. X503]